MCATFSHLQVDMLLTNEISAFRSDHVKGLKKLVAQYEAELVSYEAAVDKYLSKKAATAAAAAASSSSMAMSASIVTTSQHSQGSLSGLGQSSSAPTSAPAAAATSGSPPPAASGRPGEIVGFGSGGVVKVTPASSALLSSLQGHGSTGSGGQFVNALAGISGSAGTQLVPGDEERFALATARRAFELSRFDLVRSLNDCRGINRCDSFSLFYFIRSVDSHSVVPSPFLSLDTHSALPLPFFCSLLLFSPRADSSSLNAC